MTNPITITTYLETCDDRLPPLLQSLWYLGDPETSEVEIEVDCWYDPGEPQTWEDPGVGPGAECDQSTARAVVDGAEYPLPPWVELDWEGIEEIALEQARSQEWDDHDDSLDSLDGLGRGPW